MINITAALGRYIGSLYRNIQENTGEYIESKREYIGKYIGIYRKYIKYIETLI